MMRPPFAARLFTFAIFEMNVPNRAGLLKKIAQISQPDFEETALEVFRFQAERNLLFKKWLQLLGRNPLEINRLEEIPFLPISFFKTHKIKTGRWPSGLGAPYFESSGTTGQVPSRHFVRDFPFYLKNTERGFTPFFGKIEDWTLLALLPGYLERQNSSLVAMADFFIKKTGSSASGFYLNDLEKLAKTFGEINSAAQNYSKKTMLLGVSFALLDFAEKFAGKLDLSKIHVVETGGMKGRRREITRDELHEILRNSLNIKHIHSEYGMTELFSQAWSINGAPFAPAPTMRVFVKEINDPFAAQPPGRSGQICIIDLANLDTCSFIATEDLGRAHENGHFEILGRMDVAEMRGCNLMVE